MRDLVFVCEDRKNMTPLFFDANHPEEYKDNICEVDVVYQDVAQKNQAEIFLKNCDMFLKKGGFALLAVKSRSIDVTKNPKDIYNLVLDQLKTAKLKIIETKEIGPYEKDHLFIVCQK